MSGPCTCTLCGEPWHDNQHQCNTVALALARSQLEQLQRSLNAPEVWHFVEGVKREALHQRQRWGNEHDAGKEPEDWFWLIGYLSGKALRAARDGDKEKALHHTISSAAVLTNWHAALIGTSNAMRPGIDPASVVELAELQAAE